MIFVRYEGCSENYRLFNPKTQKITIAASATIDEKTQYYTFPKTVGAVEEKRPSVVTNDRDTGNITYSEGSGDESDSEGDKTDELPEEATNHDTVSENQ